MSVYSIPCSSHAVCRHKSFVDQRRSLGHDAYRYMSQTKLKLGTDVVLGNPGVLWYWITYYQTPIYFMYGWNPDEHFLETS